MTLIKNSLPKKALFLAGKPELNLSDLTTALVSGVIWVIRQNGGACQTNCFLCLPLIDTVPLQPRRCEWLWLFACFRLICQEEAIPTLHICFGWPESEQTVFGQWCHLKYAGMVHVYWKVERCINKAWRYFRCAANQNIELLSFCHSISKFFLLPGFRGRHWISSVPQCVRERENGEPRHTDLRLKVQNTASDRILN